MKKDEKCPPKKERGKNGQKQRTIQRKLIFVFLKKRDEILPKLCRSKNENITVF